VTWCKLYNKPAGCSTSGGISYRNPTLGKKCTAVHHFKTITSGALALFALHKFARPPFC
jgi:hypothetical protein